MIYHFYVKYKSGREEVMRVEGGAKARKTKEDLKKASDIGVLTFKEEAFETKESEKRKALQSYLSGDTYNKVKEASMKSGKSCSATVRDIVEEKFNQSCEGGAMIHEFDLCAVLYMRLPIEFYADCAVNDNDKSMGSNIENIHRYTAR